MRSLRVALDQRISAYIKRHQNTEYSICLFDTVFPTRCTWGRMMEWFPVVWVRKYCKIGLIIEMLPFSMVSCLKNLCIQDNRRNLAPNVHRPPIIYPEHNNGGVLPPLISLLCPSVIT